MLDYNTKLIGLIGNPLHQSFAPKMYNKVFKKLNLNVSYIPFEIDQKYIEEVVNGMKYMNFIGFNVTKPYKISIIPYLDKIDETAKQIGAVNTVVIKDKKAIGYNTDGDGFLKGLNYKTKFNLKNSNIFVLGSGGSARAICFVMAKQGVKKLYITDKYDSFSNKLVKDINNFTNEKKGKQILSNNEQEIQNGVFISDIIINATGIGMQSSISKTPISIKNLNEYKLICDLTYNPSKTRFIKKAEESGCDTMNGIPMLINQGAKNIHLWLDILDTHAILKEAIMK